MKLNSILKIRDLKKIYKSEKKENKALRGINFDVYEGEILCLLGPNGAGKSTTINILSTTLKSDAGEIFYNDEKVSKSYLALKSNLGIVPQDLAIYEGITAEDNVKFFAALYGIKGEELKKNVHNALEFVGLADKKSEKVKTFSGGLKRRLNIACALAHNPKIIIMDEPTVGIDPQSRNHILESIKKLRDLGKTIIYTSHYIEEIEEISTRVIVIDHGLIIAEGTKEKLKDDLGSEKVYALEVDTINDLKKENFFIIEGIKSIDFKENNIIISTLKGIENLDKIIALIMNKGLRIKNVSTVTESLEVVFLKLTGRNLRD